MPDPDGDSAAEDAAETVVFAPPPGFKTGGHKPGETFEAVASLQMGDDGNLTLLKLDGIPLSGPDEDAAEAAPDDGGGFEASVEKGLSASPK